MKRIFWTKEQIELLKQNYPNMPMPDLEALFCRKKMNIYEKAASLGIKRSAEYMAEYGCRFKKGKSYSPATEFKKGHRAWNKGTNFTAGAGVQKHNLKQGKYHTTHCLLVVIESPKTILCS